MTTADIQHIADAVIAFASVVIPIVAIVLGKAGHGLIVAHTTTTQQALLEKIAFMCASAAEQKLKGDSGKARFTQADTFFAAWAQALLPKGQQPTADQRASLIETAVRAINAGAIALAPDVAAVLTPDAAGAAPGVNVDAIIGQANDAATGTAHDVATLVAQNAVQAGLQDVVNQVFARFAAALTPQTSTPTATQPSPVPDTTPMASAPSTTRIQVAANLQTPDDGTVRLDGTLTPIPTPTPPSKSSRSKAATTAVTATPKEPTETVSTTTITASTPPSILLTRPSAGSVVFVDEPAQGPTPSPAPPPAQG